MTNLRVAVHICETSSGTIAPGTTFLVADSDLHHFDSTGAVRAATEGETASYAAVRAATGGETASYAASYPPAVVTGKRNLLTTGD
jgi:hypothetical protein